MGQSGPETDTVAKIHSHPRVSIFPTPLGWMGLVGRNDCVAYLTIGHADRAAVRQALPAEFRDAPEHDWAPGLRDRLERYAAGESICFDDVLLESHAATPFRQRVLEVTRKLPYGATSTYGELAAKAGRPGAARAVGTAMSTNCVPLIIPCHRVVGAGGSLGGYSAPQGIGLKRRLLEMEKIRTER